MSGGYDRFFKAAKNARAQRPAVKKPKAKSEITEAELRKAFAVKKPRQAISFNWPLLAVLGIFCALLGWWTVDPRLPERIVSQVEIKLFGQALASEAASPAKNDETKGEAPEKSAAAESASKGEASTKEGAPVEEDLSQYKKLRERKATLDLREKELNELEEELHKQKQEIEARIRKLEELRGQISTVLKERVEIDQEKVNKLVETYSNMKPKQAAEIIAGIDEDLAVEVLGKMKKKNAAEVMNLLEASKARSLSEKYAGYKRQ